MVEKTVLQVNAQSFEIEVQPDTPLLYVLRNQLNLKAPKYGCGMGQCGSCMVLVAGQTMYSCQLTVAQVQQHQITTLEGLGATDKIGSSVVDAFLKEQAAQCGFCTNGMIMSAVSLLRQNPNPTDPEIRAYLQGNLCRCAVHNRIIKAVKRVVNNEL